MGAAVCAAVRADPGLELVAVVDPAYAGTTIADLVAGRGPEVLVGAGAEVAVDFTVAAAAVGNAAWCAAHGVHTVIGTTGLGAPALAELERSFTAGPANCIFAPNFAIGAVLMMRFAELAAPWFETVEVIELHHDAKLDSPSGTSVLTAQRIAAARGKAARDEAAGAGARLDEPATGARPDEGPARGVEAAPGVRAHSVRLRGLVAHQEVLFGTTGQVLTLRHDSLDRSSFMPGVIIAIKAVPHRRGFTVGLDGLLGL
jgi:4-hydroxy-tetrahydrodipicolinate reductase